MSQRWRNLTRRWRSFPKWATIRVITSKLPTHRISALFFSFHCLLLYRLKSFWILSENRVLKRLRHVAMALKNSVPNKLAFRSKWPRYLSHRCFLSSQTKRNRLKREKITFTQIMWKHLITRKEFYEEKSTQVWKRRFIKSRWVNATIYQLMKHTVLFWSENVVVFSSDGLGRNFSMFSKDTMFVDRK